MILFVIGMGRSGSSALTRVLSLCGGTLPAQLVGANEGNPLGHWEPRDALALNESFLAEHGSSWFDPTLRLQEETAFAREEAAAYLERIESFLRPLSAARMLVIKEPRITALSDFWFEAARRLRRPVRIVIPVRHPGEVIASLAARDGTSAELSSALWLKYNMLAERQSRAHPRVFIEYPNLLRDWRGEIARIAARLSIDLSVRDETSIEQFLRQDLRRQRHRGEITEIFGDTWISRAYGILSAAARDEPVETAVLDEIFESYRRCERSFRIALRDFRTRFTVAVHGSQTLTKLIYALAGGNSETLRACIASRWYQEQNPDVLAAGRDPYEHWTAHGVAEGRLPCDDPLSLLVKLMHERLAQSDSPIPTPAPVSVPAAAP